jgi:hypothetical protein
MSIYTVKEAVATKIASSGEKVFEAVAECMAQEEIGKRIALVLQHYTELDNIEKELKKLKQDLWDGQGYNGYMKETFDKRVKLETRKAKVIDAIDRAIDMNDFAKLKELGENKDVSKA